MPLKNANFAEDSDLSQEQMPNDEEYVPLQDTHEPVRFSQEELKDLIRDLSLSKEKSELLGSRLKEKNLLERGASCSKFRYRHKSFFVYYAYDDDVCYCSDVEGLMQKLEVEDYTENWRVFIDSSKTSLKAVLLHNGNELPSIPLFHAVNLKETYESMALLLRRLRYENFKWKICGDLKVVALLLGLQLGYTKYMCFLCLWNSMDDENHFSTRDWPPRPPATPGRFNIKQVPLVSPENVFLPPCILSLV